MLKLGLGQENKSGYRVLCLGAHSDDIEIGCGGTIMRWIGDYPDTEFCWVVFSASGERAQESHEGADIFLRHAKEKHIIVKDFRDGFFPYIGLEIKEYFEQLKQEFSPDLVFTHYRNDLHQDHRLISDLTWNTFRDHLILEYEVPKYDGDLGCPTLYVHLDETTCRRKIQAILDTFRTQVENRWFSEETFTAILRLRGIESNAPDKYAEAFYCRKMVL